MLNLNLSVSVKGSTRKPEGNEIARMQFQKENITLDTFVDYVKQGKTFCYCFNTTNDIFSNSEKTKKNFEYTNIIAIDVDDSAVAMKDYVDTLTYKPSVIYTTYSNGLKGYRFRLVYCFEDKITDENTYKGLYNAILKNNNMVLSDNCMKSVNQCFIGNGSGNVEVINNNVVYNTNIFDVSDYFSEVGKDIERRNKSVTEAKKAHLEASFKNDLNTMKRVDFLLKYMKIYPIKERVDLIDTGKGYFLYPQNYVEVYRKYNWIDGKARLHKWHNGENRRKHLFMTALTFKYIFDNLMGLEHLVYLLIRELEYYYINDAEDYITVNEVVNIAYNALKSEYGVKAYRKHNFKVDKEYWNAQGITARQAANIIRRENRDNEIGEIYDCSLTDKQNVQFMNEQGLKISIDGLKLWRKRNGIEKYQSAKSAKNNQKCISNNKETEHTGIINGDTLSENDTKNGTKDKKTEKMTLFTVFYDSQSTDDMNIERMNNHGLTISRRTYFRYKKELIKTV